MSMGRYGSVVFSETVVDFGSSWFSNLLGNFTILLNFQFYFISVLIYYE